MRVTFWYLVYVTAGLVLMYVCQFTDRFPPLVEITATTIWVWTLVWASNVTYVVWIGKLLKRAKENEM